MKKAMKKLCLIMAAIMCIAILPCQVNAADAKPKLFIIGDSMAASYDAAKYPMTGWGQAIENFFTDEVEIVNCADAGESSRSFYYTYWKSGVEGSVLDQIGEGDYLLFTFGANDTKADDTTLNLYRKTDTELPSTTEIPETNGATPDPNTYSFKAFMKRYITDTQGKGATPIMLTPPERRVNTSSSGTTFAVETMSTYSQAIKDLADEINGDSDENNDILCLKDISSESLALYTNFGEENSKKLFVYTSDEEDNTHFRDFGATEIAGIVVEELIKNGSDLTQYLKTVSTPIIYDADHNTVGTAFSATTKKVKGTTLYPRAQIINKDDEATTVQVIMAEYDSEGTLIDVLSKDEFSVPAKSVESFDAVYTLSDEEAHAGTIKMFVWKGYDSLLPLDSKLIEWDFTKLENSGISPLVDEKFDSYSENATINGSGNWATGAGTFTATSVSGNMGMLFPEKTNANYTSVTFDAITLDGDSTMETVVEFDLYDTSNVDISLRSGSKDIWVINTAAGNLKINSQDSKHNVSGCATHVKFVVNEKDMTADLYLNGSDTEALSDLSRTGTSYSTITGFMVKTKSTSLAKGWIDNLLIYRQPIGTN